MSSKRILMTIATATALFVTVSTLQLRAEDYAVHIMSNKKVIRADMLGLPGNTTLEDALYLLPEFVGRNGNDLLAGYDVRLEGKSVGESRDAILMNTLMYDVKEIEITDSPTASQQRNGPAGVVNIKLKAVKEGLGGNVNAVATTEWNAASTATLRYKKGKVEMLGLLGLEYYRPTDITVFEKNSKDKNVFGADTVMQRYFQESARFDFKYEPTEKDRIRVWVWESHFNSAEWLNEGTVTTIYRDDLADKRMNGGRLAEEIVESVRNAPRPDHKTNMTVMADYRHLFKKKSEFVYSADYSMSTSKRASVTPHSVVSSMSFTTPGGRPVKFKAGADLTYKVNDIKYDDNTSLYVSPYVDLTFKGKKLEVNTGARYQYYRLFSINDHDFTVNANALWQFRPHDALRLIVNRNLIRPSAEKMYPVMVWNQDRGSYVKGNPSLHQVNLHNAMLDYIFDRHVGKAYVVTNLSVGYNRVDGLVEETVLFDEDVQKFYLTYANSGVNNIFTAKANVILTRGIVSVSLTGNVFHNVMNMAGGKDSFNSFNIGASPIFKFDKGWTLSARALYNSRQKRNNMVLGDCLFASVTLNKTVGKWDFKAMLSDIFDYYTSDYEMKNGVEIMSNKDLYTRFFGLGVTYRIGR